MNMASAPPTMRVEMRRPLAQQVRALAYASAGAGTYIAALALASASRFAITIMTAFVVGLVLSSGFKQRRFVLWITERGVYEGRDDRRPPSRLGGPDEVEMDWTEISDVRMAGSWWSRRVELTPSGIGLPIRLGHVPRTWLLNPDPSFEARVNVLLDAWNEHRTQAAVEPTRDQ